MRVEKEEFYEKLFEVVSAINDKESLFLCGDVNGHIGQRVLRECNEVLVLVAGTQKGR